MNSMIDMKLEIASMATRKVDLCECSSDSSVGQEVLKADFMFGRAQLRFETLQEDVREVSVSAMISA